MKILSIDPNNPHSKAIDEAVAVLLKGGTLVYPTDTCYGLGADMTNIIAVDKVYKIKQRSIKRPLSIIVKNISAIKKIALVEKKEEKILRKYLPGAITFVLLNLDFKNFPQNTVGVRIPDYKITQLIAERLRKPYATTSANVSGKPPCFEVEEIIKQFKYAKYQPDLILDTGPLPKTVPSTVVNICSWPPRVVRQGPVKFIN